MKKLLALAAAGEAAMGLVLLVYPPIVVRLLFNDQIAGAGIVMSRMAGIALIALGLACWPGSEATVSPPGTPGNAVLQPSCNAIPRLSGHLRRMGRGSVVASGCCPRSPDDSSRPGVFQWTKDTGRKNVDQKGERTYSLHHA